MTDLINKARHYMASLVVDGGPSLTRWLALRVTEAMTFFVGAMIFTMCHNIWIGRGSDAGIISAIVTISLALITATSLNQNTKLTLDAKSPGDPSTISTPGATLTTGPQGGKDGSSK